MKWILWTVPGLLLGCSAATPEGYTGRIRMQDGVTEYVALNDPSTVGGACEGWKTVEIRDVREAKQGIKDLICWQREGDDMVVNGKDGHLMARGPASLWNQ